MGVIEKLCQKVREENLERQDLDKDLSVVFEEEEEYKTLRKCLQLCKLLSDTTSQEQEKKMEQLLELQMTINQERQKIKDLNITIEKLKSSKNSKGNASSQQKISHKIRKNPVIKDIKEKYERTKNRFEALVEEYREIETQGLKSVL